MRLATLACMLLTSSLSAQTIHVDPIKGDDASTGLEPARPLKTFKRATALLKPGVILSIMPNERPCTEPLLLRTSGTPEQPIVVEGNGAVIDLGTDLSAAPWKADGDHWILEDPRAPFPPPRPGAEQAASLFVDDVPLYTQHPKQAGPFKPGQVLVDEQGRLRAFFPPGKKPGACRIVRPRDTMGTSAVAIQASFVTIRNLTAQYAGNDGFNLHGHHKGVRLESVKAFFNGDEGISAHETFEAIVENAEVAWNGSISGGVADVNQSVTIYRHCLIHHNRAAFFFDKEGHHEIHDTVTFDNNGHELPATPAENVTIQNSLSLPPKVIPEAKDFPPSLKGLIERAAEIRRREAKG